MDKKRLIVYSLACLLLAGAVIYGVVALTVGKRPTPFDGHVADKTPQNTQDVYLYFGSMTDTFLVGEKRTLYGAGDPSLLSKNIVNALISGPTRKNLVRTLPEGVACRAFYLADKGTAYVDFSSDIREKHPGGSEAELLAIYSIVNSLVLNVDEVKKVKILVEGSEADTLGGHIDLRFPFDANMRMVR
jgi:spore germination protein GerM